jgi:hypothetical protein
MVVDGFETEDQARGWMNAHRETLVDETLLKAPDHFVQRTVAVDRWRTDVLANEKLSDWEINIATDGYCWRDTKTIQLPADASPSLFLHEVAHALVPEPEGSMRNHYHGGNWAAEYGRLVDRYLRPLRI